MNKLYSLKVAALIAILFGSVGSALAARYTLTTVGTYTITVPSGCNLLQVDMAGGAGGNGSNSVAGGKGGRVTGLLAVTPGQQVFVYVGGKGTNYNGTYPCLGGKNGSNAVGVQGSGGYGYYNGGGGGGATDLRLGAGVNLTDRVMVAGGGGGASYYCGTSDYGGGGGGLTGETGYYCGSPSISSSGYGGTQTGPGAFPTCCSGSSMIAATGATGGSNNGYSSGGGGGGGYYGGSAANYGGGSGGSSFIGGIGVTSATTTASFQAGDGYAVITELIPAVFSSSSFIDFGTVGVNDSSVPVYTVLRGEYLAPASGNITVTVPGGYGISTSANGFYSTTLTIPYSAGTFSGYGIYVKFKPTAPTSFNNLMTITGGGTPLPVYVPLYGVGSDIKCSGTPTAGTAMITPTSGSSGTFFTVGITGASTNAGIFYQWQSSTSTSGPWTDVPGAIRPSYTFQGLTANMYYRCRVRCGSGAFVNSTSVAATFVASDIYATACSGTPNPGAIYTPNSSCSAYLSNVYMIGSTQDSAITHQWLISTDNISYSAVSGATGAAMTQSVTTTVWLKDRLTCKASSKSIDGPSVKLTLNATPDPISGFSAICSGVPTVYGSTTPLGTWTTSNTGIATVDSTGTVIGNPGVAGSATISYTISNGCSAIFPVTINPSPAAIAGASGVCKGNTTALSSSPGGGTWTSYDNTIATVNSGGVVSGVDVGITPVTYEVLGTGCRAITSVTVNQQPAAISGPSNVCVGSCITLGQAIAGGTWTSNNAFQASVNNSTGYVCGLISGTSPIITYTLGGGCFVTKTLAVSSLPAAITGVNYVCAGATTTLSNSVSGTWASGNGSVATANIGTGVITGVAKGTATVTFTAASTGCNASTTVQVNGLPAVYSVTGGGNFCPGSTGVHVGVTASETGVNYYLYEGTTNVDSKSGSSTAVDFNLVNTVGTYTVLAQNPTTLCKSNMLGTVTVGMFTPPVDNNVSYGGTGAASYCSGGTGVKLQVPFGSDLNVNYKVYLNGGIVAVKSVPGTGTGAPLDLGFFKVAGMYTVIASDNTTSCTTVQTGGPLSVTVDTLPGILTVTSTGNSYCAGGAGLTICMPSTSPFITYEALRNGSSLPVVNDFVGDGTSHCFASITAGGTYTVKASNAKCSVIMGNIPVTVNSLPAKQVMNGGGAFCTGDAMKHIGLTYALNNTKYQLYRIGGGVVDSATTFIGGANSGLDFGGISAGTYIVLGKSAAGCIDTMTGTKTIIENTPPAVLTVSGGGGFCVGDAGSSILVNASENGVTYRLYKGTALISSKTSTSAGSTITFGPYPTAGVYSVTAINGFSCTSNMSGTATISVNPTPVAYKVQVRGSASYCANDTAKHIILAGSQAGTNYTLKLGGVPVAVIGGTGDTLDMGANNTIPGVYTIEAENAEGCKLNMTGSATISINPLPAKQTISVTGTGDYCAGDGGLHILSSGSNTGVNYQLYRNTTTMVGPVIGGISTRSLDFGIQTLGGTYTVVAKVAATGCIDTMDGSGTINVIALPSPYSVTSSSATKKYCPGGTGVDVQLTNSVVGFKYKLYQNGILVDSISGGVSPLNFGNRLVGIYTVKAVDETYGCKADMPGSVTIGNYALPRAYSVTGSSNYCPVGALPSVGLANSDTGVTYSLFDGSAYDAPVAGIGGALDFGPKSGPVTYTVMATDLHTTCVNDMAGSAVIMPKTIETATVSMFPTMPSACSGSPDTLTANSTFAGTGATYMWSVTNSGVLVTTGSGKTFTFVPAAKDTVYVVMMPGSDVCVVPGAVYNNDSEGVAKIIAPVTPSVAIKTMPTSICKSAASSVTFTALPTDGGTAPIYQWKKRGVAVGTNSPTYTTSIVDSDVVFVVMASNKECRSADFVYSKPVEMTVNDIVTPVFSIIADPSNAVEKGTEVTFTAMISNITDTTVTKKYVWTRNGETIAGATSGVYRSSQNANGDRIAATVTSTNSCGAASNQEQIFMTIGTTGIINPATAISDVRVVPNPNKGLFTVKGILGTTVSETVTLSVTNMLGQVVYNNAITATNGKVDGQIQLSNNLANGMYLLNFSTGTEHKVFHFVIEQ